MIKDNLRVKTNITMDDQIAVIEAIVSSYFVGGDYTPWFSSTAEIIAVAKYFITGYTLESYDDGTADTIMSVYSYDKDFKKIVDQYKDHGSAMGFIRKMVDDKVSFLKDKAIHTVPDLSIIVEAANIIIKALDNFSKMNFSSLTPENIQTATSVLNRLNDAGVKLDRDTLVDIIKDAADFDLSKAAKEIIEEKNKKIMDLSKYKAIHDVRNVVADKKE